MYAQKLYSVYTVYPYVYMQSVSPVTVDADTNQNVFALKPYTQLLKVKHTSHLAKYM